MHADTNAQDSERPKAKRRKDATTISREHSDNESRPKRQKVDMACEQCRSRKGKCDGVKPSCGSCTRKQEACVYKVLNTQLSGTNDYINSLLSKISSLEDQMSHMQNALDLAQTEAVSRILLNTGNLLSNAEILPVSSSGPTLHPHIAPKTSGVVDGMGMAAILGKSSTAEDRWYGTSSASSLMNQVFQAIGQKDAAGPLDKDFDTWSIPTTVDNLIFPSDYVTSENFSLLPRTLTDFLLNRYWSNVHTLHPFLHKPTFMQSYEQLWHPNAETAASENPFMGLGEAASAGPTSLVYHGALNIMLVLGLQFTDLPVSEQNRLTFICLGKSKSLIKLDLFNEGSLAVCQTLLLLTQYFQSTTSPAKCWNTVGVACRVGQALGLHADDEERSRQRFKPIEREMRKRVWFSCLAFDMLIGMALGRPIQLRQRHRVPLPEITNDEYLQNDIPQPLDHFSDLHFYVESIKLFRIMRRAISVLYKDDEPTMETGGFDNIIFLDKELSQFSREVPDALHWDRQATVPLRMKETVITQQRHVLHLRFLYARMLVYRPLLTQFCRLTISTEANDKPDEASPTISQIAMVIANSGSMTCVQTAIELSAFTDSYAESQLTGEWWYNMFYTRTSAMAIMMGLLCGAIRQSIGLARLQGAWETCRNVLHSRLPASPVVMNCIHTLDTMHRQVSEHLDGSTVSETTDGRSSNASAIPDPSFVNIPFPGIAMFGNSGAGTFDSLDGGFFDPAFNFGLDSYGVSLL